MYVCLNVFSCNQHLFLIKRKRKKKTNVLKGFYHNSQELEKMKEIAKLKQMPPVYTGKWASATDEEVQEELAKGTPYTYRFRVPKEGSLKISDLIRGEVSFIFSSFAMFLLATGNFTSICNPRNLCFSDFLCGFPTHISGPCPSCLTHII